MRCKNCFGLRLTAHNGNCLFAPSSAKTKSDKVLPTTTKHLVMLPTPRPHCDSPGSFGSLRSGGQRAVKDVKNLLSHATRSDPPKSFSRILVDRARCPLEAYRWHSCGKFLTIRRVDESRHTPTSYATAKRVAAGAGTAQSRDCAPPDSICCLAKLVFASRAGAR